MADNKRVLILCTGNSARSQMAEGLLRHDARNRFTVESAGTKPSIVRPEAIAVMKESPTQLNILTPPGAISGSVEIQVTNNGAMSANFAVQAQAESPSFFVFNGGPYITAVHLNGSLVGPTTLYPGYSTPAQPGETIVIFANGFGPTSTPVVSGSSSQSGSLSPLPVINIGGIGAMVSF